MVKILLKPKYNSAPNDDGQNVFFVQKPNNIRWKRVNEENLENDYCVYHISNPTTHRMKLC